MTMRDMTAVVYRPKGWKTAMATLLGAIAIAFAPTFALAQINFSSNPACQNQTNVTISTTLILVTPGTAWRWDTDGDGNVDVTTTANFTARTYPTAGTFAVRVDVDGNVATWEATANLTINAQLPNPIITGANQVCAGALNSNYSVSNAGAYTGSPTYQWTVVGGVIASGQGTASLNVNWQAAGNGRVTVTVTSGPCSATSSDYNVVINPLPSPVISGPLSVCPNHLQNSTVRVYRTPFLTGRTWNWTVAGGVIGTINTASIFIPNPTANTLDSVVVQWNDQTGPTTSNRTLTVAETISVTGCSFTTIPYNVTVNPRPDPVVAGPGIGAGGFACGGKTYNYTVTPQFGSNNFSWTVSGGTIVGSSGGVGVTTIQVRWGFGATGQIQVTETNMTHSPNCPFTSVATNNVVISARPNGTITGGAPNSAAPCSTTVHTYSVPSQGGVTYTWTVSTNGTVTAGTGLNQISVLWGAAGNGNVGVTVTNTTTTCDSVFTFPVVVNPLPLPVLSGNGITPTTFACAGRTYSYTTSQSVVNGTSTFTWTSTGGLPVSGTGTTATITWGVAGTGTVAFTETTGAGCVNTTSATITINPNPIPAITGAFITCVSKSPSFPNLFVYTTPLVGSNSYLWTPSANGTIVSGQGTNSVTVRWNAVGTGLMTLTETMAVTGCTTTVNSATVTIQPLPVPAVTGNTSVCGNGTMTYITPAVLGNTYNWTVTNGNVTGRTFNQVTVQWSGAGIGTVKVVESITATSCRDSSTLIVTINALPNPQITASGALAICGGSEGVTLAAPIGFNSYTWSTGQTGRSIVVQSPGTYNCTVTDANGCAGASNSISITLNTSPTVSVTASGPTTVCAGQSLVLSATAGFTKYEWSNGLTTPSINVSASGNYQCIATAGNGCTAKSNFVNVTVVPNPKPAVTMRSTSPVCQGDTVDLDAGAGYASYSWWKDGSQVAGASSRNLKVLSSGVYRAGVTNAAGCQGTSDSVVVTVNAKPSADITATKTSYCKGDTVILSAPSGVGLTYTWSNGATTQTTAIFSQTTKATKYTVAVKNTAGCVTTSGETEITEYPIPGPPVITRPTNSDSLTVSAVLPSATYQWKLNGVDIAGATGSFHNARSVGDYTVEVIGEGGCKNLSIVFKVTILGVDDEESNAVLSVYPNPTSNNVTVKADSKGSPVSVIVSNLVGVKIAEFKSNGSEQGSYSTTFDMTNLSSGTYLFTVTMNGKSYVKQIVKH